MLMPATRPSAAAPVAGLLLAAVLLAGCGKNVEEVFPLSVGFQPLEAAVPAATFKSAAGNELHPQGLGPVVPVPSGGHYTSHARGYLRAPLARVYEALHDPASSYVRNEGGTRTRLDSVPGNPFMNEEPFPVSFRVRYASTSIIGDIKFDLAYRAGPLQGTEAAPVAIGQRYQKVWGNSHIDVMSGSLVATSVPGAPEVTAVEMVAWLKADTQDQSHCDGTLVDLFAALEAKLASMPP